MTSDKVATKGPASKPLLTQITPHPPQEGVASVFLFPNLSHQLVSPSYDMFYGSFDPYNQLEM